MVRFLHTGDWQLGMTRRHLSDEAQARFSAARIDAIRTLAAVAADHGCAFAVCAGDVFEHNAVDRRVVGRALEAMAAFAMPLYLLPGNHDPLDAASVYRSPAFLARRPPNVVVLDGGAPARPVDGVAVHGAPWSSKRPLDDLVAAACAGLGEPDGTLRVLVAHGAVDRGAPDPDDPALIGLDAVEAHVAAGRLHYLALGDRHSCTDVGATGRVRYAGAPEPTDFTEVDPGRGLVVDLEEDRCTVEAVRVGTWHFVRHRVEVAGEEDVDGLAAWLGDLPAKDRTAVRLDVVGALPVRAAVRLQDVLDEAREVCASLEVWEAGSDLAVLADDADFSDLGLAGFAEQTVEDLRVLAGAGGAEAAPAAAALALLYRLAGGGGEGTA